MMFLRQEDFATVVRSTPLVSLDFIAENSRGEFLLGKRTNRPAQGYWFVPGGRVQKDETLEAAFERLTMAELGLRLPITAGQFYGVWQHFYDDNFSGTDFTTHYVVLGFRFRVSEEELYRIKGDWEDFVFSFVFAGSEIEANPLNGIVLEDLQDHEADIQRLEKQGQSIEVQEEADIQRLEMKSKTFSKKE